jgi:hypothetical protein
MYRESINAGMPMTAREIGEAFGLSARWGRDRVAEVRTDLAELATPADRADDPAVLDETTGDGTDGEQPEEVEPATEDVPTAEVREDQDDAEVENRPARTASLIQHQRIRWGVRATLTLGVIASTVANVLHAQDNPISQTIAAWPPLALLATIELISRVPVHRRELAVVRFTATALIAGIAAWVSYWHMVDVIRRYGETGASPYLIPLTVDGLVVVASVCLVELGSRIRALSAEVGQ